MNTCFQSTIPAPDTLPAIGTRGHYVMPAIVTSDGIQHAPETKTPVEVTAHIGAFGLQLREIRNPRLYIETHFTSFQPYL